MQRNTLLLLLVLLLTAATGAWAQEPATTYSVKMKDGTVDAKNWTIASGEKSAKGDAADGLTGLNEGDAVTLQYNGRLKVKGVKATSDAAAPSVPDGAISGVFSVSSTKKVYFSKGNLRYASSKWSFFDNQYDYYESHSDDAWDKFGWSTSATTYGKNTSASSSDYSGDFVDWGATMGTGWFTLSKDEWTYLFNTRTVNGGTGNGKSYTRGQSVNGKLGLVIYPDNYTGAVYSGSDWATFESAGCVFLPAAGIRSGSSVYSQGTDGYYWSASPYDTGSAYSVYFRSGNLSPASYDGRSNACSVRLVREVATSDEEAAPAEEPVTLATPLTIEALTAGTIVIQSPKVGMQYSLNGGTKTAATTDDINLAVQAGDKVQLYGNGTEITSYNDTRILGEGTGFTCNVYGNIMSLIDETGFATKKTLTNSNVFRYFFYGNNALKDASGLLLPAETLSSGCYQQMFYNCSSLTAAPDLPATLLSTNCYRQMFSGCFSLTSAPDLPATTLTGSCYREMFQSCFKLASVKCLATNAGGGGNTNNWLKDAGSQVTGDKVFYTVSTADWPNGNSGIPGGWTRQNIDN